MKLAKQIYKLDCLFDDYVYYIRTGKIDENDSIKQFIDILQKRSEEGFLSLDRQVIEIAIEKFYSYRKWKNNRDRFLDCCLDDFRVSLILFFEL